MRSSTISELRRQIAHGLEVEHVEAVGERRVAAAGERVEVVGHVARDPDVVRIVLGAAFRAAPGVVALHVAVGGAVVGFRRRHAEVEARVVAELEGAEAARAYASGMGAIAGVILGLCSKGDHIVAQKQLYGGTMQLLAGVCPRFGIDVTFVDGTKFGAFAEAVIPGRTMMVFAETPANPCLPPQSPED
mgnify:CR=1 FL=1